MLYCAAAAVVIGCALAGQLVVPGVVNPAVTQGNIASTICKPDWTATVRPPVEYTDALKREQMKALGLDVGRAKYYEEDHFIPLELGGHPRDPNNLWPQLWAISDPCSALIKDGDEQRGNRAVCAGKTTLQ